VGGRGLGALDALGVVVGDGCGALGLGEDLVEGVEDPADRADAHGRAVAEAVVGAELRVAEPLVEPAAVAAVGVAAAPAAVGSGVVAIAHQGIGGGDGEDRVVGEVAGGVEEIEVLAFLLSALVGGSECVSCYGSEHAQTLGFSLPRFEHNVLRSLPMT